MFSKGMSLLLWFWVLVAGHNSVRAQDKTLTFGTVRISLLTLSPKGDLLAFVAVANATEHAIVVLDLKTDKTVATFDTRAHRIAFSGDGKYLMTCWTIEDAPGKSITSVAFWGLQSGQREHIVEFKGHRVGITERFVFTRDLSGNKNVVVVNDLETGKAIELDLPNRLAYAISSLDGKYLLTSEKDTPPKVWDAKTGKELASVDAELRARLVARMRWPANALSADGKFQAHFGMKITFDSKKKPTIHPEGLHIFGADPNRILATFAIENKNAVQDMLFTPDSRFLIGVTGRGTIQFWDVSKITLPGKPAPP
jgi:WD40 repeat protein